MKEVREQIKVAREDFSHYAALQFLVVDESDVVIIDKTYRQ